MKVICDTNIIIDVLLERELFVEARNKKDFEEFSIPALDPVELLLQIT